MLLVELFTNEILSMENSVKHYTLSSTVGNSQIILKDPTIKKYIGLIESPILHIFSLSFLFF